MNVQASPCPACRELVAAVARRCPRCGSGIAVVSLRATIQGQERRFEQRVACDPDEVEFMDGLEATVDNPEEIPGREA
jgi:ssDNA-binding Zn-finger/Zn-ribbon topoisomerase 1